MCEERREREGGRVVMVAVGLACLVHSESKLYSVVRVVCVHLGLHCVCRTAQKT